MAIIISLDDHERLHEHAHVADALRLRDMRATGDDLGMNDWRVTVDGFRAPGRR